MLDVAYLFSIFFIFIDLLVKMGRCTLVPMSDKSIIYGFLARLLISFLQLQGLTTLNKAKSGQVSTNNGIIAQNILNASVLTSVARLKSTALNKYLIMFYSRCNNLIIGA